ncbi:uncharacterized protein LOC111712631 isoform X2 [Eurytemora carolleeae]|uniref:uncharacterized protein LOC111712631 isoform X2 n=1 Tax=Eurytemora carolleeae TaxID=1294199 RepID=UPI000C763A69|nr:uncharacterized protein LOC111712631 isoform X2 [Eurytemora carolleeae]|eukprot:XP_023343077.1 uncharacterized protein LOC111712631 isoform X2 [Eurytemora affinis]
MKNQEVWFLCVLTIMLSLGESKKFLVETMDDIPGGNEGDEVSGDDYYMRIELPKAPFQEKVPCKERTGNTTCPELMSCLRDHCYYEGQEDPWVIQDIPCAERVGKFACPFGWKCDVDKCVKLKIPCDDGKCPDRMSCMVPMDGGPGPYCAPSIDIPDHTDTGNPKTYIIETDEEDDLAEV